MCHWLENPDGFFPPAISADGKQVITSEAFNGAVVAELVLADVSQVGAVVTSPQPFPAE